MKGTVFHSPTKKCIAPEPQQAFGCCFRLPDRQQLKRTFRKVLCQPVQPLGRHLRAGLGHPIAGQNRPSRVPRRLPGLIRKPPAAHHHGAQRISAHAPRRKKVVHLSRHQRGMGHPLGFHPPGKAPGIPFPLENRKPASRRISPRRHPEAAHMPHRQRQPPHGSRTGSEPPVHRHRRVQDCFLPQGDPLRSSGAPGGGENHGAAAAFDVGQSAARHVATCILPESFVHQIERLHGNIC